MKILYLENTLNFLANQPEGYQSTMDLIKSGVLLETKGGAKYLKIIENE